MKIIEYIPQLGSGGGERFTVDLCNELSLKHDVTLCISHSLDKFGFYKDEISSRVKVVSFNKKQGFDITLPFKVLKLIKKERPDIVQTHLMALAYTAIASVVHKKPKYFHTVHNGAKEESDGPKGEKIRRFLFGKKYVTPVTISPESLKSFVEFYGINAPMIANGRNVPSDLAISIEVQEEFLKYRSTCNTKVIVQLAHVGHQKRQDVMARVIDRLTKEGYDVEVLMVGELNEQKMVDDIRLLNNPHIHLLGGKHNPLEYLKAADAYGLSSSFEGLPISLIEALGVGAVPVCTPVGGIVNLVNDGVNGFLSTDISEESYYIAVKRFLDLTPEALTNMKKAALDSYAPYSMTECASKYEQLFTNQI